jgi:HTH-type transcriptional regulator/antitoxin HigA
MSQADLAHALGMKEQQIQRYEAERYRSISLQNYRRIAAVLGVELHAEIVNANDAWLRQITVPESPQFSERQTKAIMQHAKQRSWFEVPTSADEQQALLRDFINESNARLASPALLRTGLRTVDLKEDVALAAWRARVVQQAEAMSAAIDNQFDPLDISWVRDLIQSSVHSDGPVRAQNMLRDKGIAVVVEPQITGLRLDGAAFLVNGLPVIALTIRNDRVDNFWFTLLHELGHIFLHQQEGLVAGFFDEEIDSEKTDELELQANQFAGSILIPSERWRMSPARISKSPAPIEEFARQLGIHPAIVFGRVRKERGDYSLFADRLGSGQVRSQLLR